ncbi:MAG TPA: hypothetical protein VFC28_10875 [Opitutaceae bacterium]|nr:hypothetical protein [Opitutaceae bacterium]
MKTLLALLFPFVLITAVIWLDARRLDAGVLFLALAAAAFFAVALNDCTRCQRSLAATPSVGRSPISSHGRTLQKACVLCEGTAS